MPELVVRVPHCESGLTLSVNLRRHVAFWWRGTRNYEASYVRLLREIVAPGDTVYDIGANIGFYSLLFSRWVGEKGCVVVFEPDPSNLLFLQSNLEINQCRNVMVRKTALGGRSGISDFSLDQITGCTGRLGRGPTYGQTNLGDGRISLLQVQVESIDELGKSGLPSPRIMKLDIEGGEADVLYGAAATLKTYRPIVISELSRWGCSSNNEAPTVLELLRQAGYLVWNLDTGDPIRHEENAWMVIGIHESLVESKWAKQAIGRLQAT
jgi:FkbM family methyltransferase